MLPALVLLVMLREVRGEMACAEPCSCHATYLRGVTTAVVDCSERGLFNVPTDHVDKRATHFVLHDNYISDVPQGSFSNLRRLKEIYLYKNFIQNIEDNAFLNLPSLRILSLHSNRLAKISNGTFSGLRSLQELFLFSNFLEELSPSTFLGLRSLQKLFLQENLLRHIPSGTFQHLTSLERLTLSRNHLVALEPGSFSGLVNLQDLQLAYNKLRSLPVGLFKGLDKLKSLNLDHNLLSEIMDNSFFGLPSLLSLWLNHNRVSSIHRRGLSGLKSLNKLLLHNNQLEMFIPGTFLELRSLEVLTLSENKFHVLLNFSFAGLRSLKQLYLHDNLIERIEPGAFTDLHHLSSLFMYRNNISTLTSGMFESLASLGELHLGVNRIAEIEEGAFSGLRNLQTLLLNSNKLASLYRTSFQGLDTLLRLFIYYNDITYVERGAFEPLSNLVELIWALPLNLLEVRPELLHSASNRLHCDCNARWFKTWLEQRGMESVLCASPPSVENSNLLNLTDAQLACNPVSLKVQPDSHYGRPGFPVVFSCNVFPGASYSWYKDGMLLTKNSSVSVLNSGKLTLHNFTYYQAGVYECIAKNDAGLVTAKVHLFVGASPQFLIKPPETIVAKPNRPLYIRCEAIGMPTPRVTWAKNGSLLMDDTGTGLTIITNQGWLVFVQLRTEHVGVFECLATNELGTASMSVAVHLEPVDSCFSSCHPVGGDCEPEYTCRCRPGFSGPFCHLGMDNNDVRAQPPTTPSLIDEREHNNSLTTAGPEPDSKELNVFQKVSDAELLVVAQQLESEINDAEASITAEDAEELAGGR